MSSLPTIGVVTTSTNAASRGYYSFFATIDTWGKIADQIVIVDGGTDDNTYAILKNWTQCTSYKIICSPETYWDLHGRFHLAQWGMNTRIGMEQLETDWAVIVPGDHILDIKTIKNLRQELLKHQNTIALKFCRQRYRLGTRVETDYKFYFLNLKKIRNENINVGWGLDKITNHTPDDPIVFDQETRFLDAVNGAEKRHLAGTIMPIPDVLELIGCWSYGFYFFTLEQALSHLKDFHLCYNVRYFGRPVRSERWHMQRENFYRISGFKGREEELKKHHVPEIRRLIEHFYQPDMIGSAICDLRVQSTRRYWQYMKRFLDYAETLRFMRSGFPSVMRNQKWSAVGEKSEPLDLRALYRQQDSFLPAQFQSAWDQHDNKLLARS